MNGESTNKIHADQNDETWVLSALISKSCDSEDLTASAMIAMSVVSSFRRLKVVRTVRAIHLMSKRIFKVRTHPDCLQAWPSRIYPSANCYRKNSTNVSQEHTNETSSWWTILPASVASISKDKIMSKARRVLSKQVMNSSSYQVRYF